MSTCPQESRASPAASPYRLPDAWYEEISPYNYEESRQYESGLHRGIDVHAKHGLVRSPERGLVVFSGEVAGRQVVVIRPTRRVDGIKTSITFTSSSMQVNVARGASVGKGTIVGTISDDQLFGHDHESRSLHVGIYDVSRRSNYLPIAVGESLSHLHGMIIHRQAVSHSGRETDSGEIHTVVISSLANAINGKAPVRSHTLAGPVLAGSLQPQSVSAGDNRLGSLERLYRHGWKSKFDMGKGRRHSLVLKSGFSDVTASQLSNWHILAPLPNVTNNLREFGEVVQAGHSLALERGITMLGLRSSMGAGDSMRSGRHSWADTHRAENDGINKALRRQLLLQRNRAYKGKKDATKGKKDATEGEELVRDNRIQSLTSPTVDMVISDRSAGQVAAGYQGSQESSETGKTVSGLLRLRTAGVYLSGESRSLNGQLETLKTMGVMRHRAEIAKAQSESPHRFPGVADKNHNALRAGGRILTAFCALAIILLLARRIFKPKRKGPVKTGQTVLIGLPAGGRRLLLVNTADTGKVDFWRQWRHKSDELIYYDTDLLRECESTSGPRVYDDSRRHSCSLPRQPTA